MSVLRKFVLFAISFTLFSCKATNPGPDSGVRSATESISPTALYDSIDSLLASYVQKGLVDYKALQAEPLLDSVVQKISVFSEDSLLNRKDSLVFWSNAYNMNVLYGVINELNITAVSQKDFAFFEVYKVVVAGETLSLNALEKKFKSLSPIDPRYHFSLNCGAVSCPELHGQAFRSETWDKTLLVLGQNFLADASKNKIEKDKVVLSTIFHWNAPEFQVAGNGKIVDAILPYVLDASAKEILEGLDNSFFANSGNFAYNWDLNQVK